VGNTAASSAKKTARVYDILNAGPDRRFTVSGKLVSNCYGLGDIGLLDLMAVTYATADMELPDYIDQEWCAKFIQMWFELYPDAHQYLESMHGRALRYGLVWSPFGRVRLIPEVRSMIERVVAAGLRQGGNMPIQGDAADVMKIGMGRVERVWERVRTDGVECEALLPVHDELISEVEEDWAECAVGWKESEMGRALVDEKSGREWSLVPLLAEGKVMERWEK
jgi:DNA polymerase I-like protein with 3'-5' exonuclease and polymerase domains